MGRKHGSVSADKPIAAEDLRGILRRIHKKLKAAGVPEDRLPKNEAVVSKLLDWIDQKKVDEWIESYAKTMS